MALTALLYVTALLFGFFGVRACFHLKWARRLPLAPALKGAGQRCSVIVAARDEADRLEQTVGHLLAQRDVDLEVIIVDDRSTDRTPEILSNLARDPRVKTLRVNTLPEKWLGKCHACHVASRIATGDWLLFTDADCWMKPDVLARALAVAAQEKVQHVTLTPGVAARTWPARASHVAFLLSALDWLARVNQDAPSGHLGVGAFNLVKAETYRKFGGHETLRLSVVDDIKLGLLVRRSGGRTRAFIGGDDAECHWGVTVRQFFKIMEKNYFAAIDYRISLGIAVGVVFPILWAAAVVGPLTGRFSGLCSFMGLLAMALPGIGLCRRLRWPAAVALLVPFVFPVLYLAILNSMVRTLAQGGIRWRDTFYPLKELRSGNVY